MAKRLSDTGKWDKAWFRQLPPKYKCFWEYLRDKCTLIGFWEIDYESASFHIGEKIIQDEVLKFFEKKIEIIDDKILILGFCHFQYGETLNLKSPIHKKIFDLLNKYTLYDTLYNRVVNRVEREREVIVKEEEEEINFEKSEKLLNAYDFLKEKETEKMEYFEMQNKKLFQDYDVFITNFNCKITEERKEYDPKILFARLKRMCANWDHSKKHKSKESNYTDPIDILKQELQEKIK